MSQPTSNDIQNNLNEAADRLKRGEELTPEQLRYAIGYGAKLAMDSGKQTTILNVIVILLAGRPRDALVRLIVALFGRKPADVLKELVDLVLHGNATPDGTGSTASEDPLVSFATGDPASTDSGAHSNPSPSSMPGRGGRRAQRA